MRTVSVVIAVFNGVPYIRRAIDSALDQSYPPHEVIVIDDGSQDTTPQLLKEYGSKIIMRRFDNAGVATAMNRGLELATGDYVAFLDHDDVWFRDKVKMQVESLVSFPNAGLSCSNYAVRPVGMEDRRMLRHYSKLRSLMDIDPAQVCLTKPLTRLLAENFVGTSTAVMVSRAVTQKVGWFNKNYKISGDYDYWLRCAAVADFTVLRDVLFYKRTHATNISASTVHMLAEHEVVLKDFARLHPETIQDGLQGIYSYALANTCYLLGDACFRENKRREGFSHYKDALRARQTPLNITRYLYKSAKKTLRLS